MPTPGSAPSCATASAGHACTRRPALPLIVGLAMRAAAGGNPRHPARIGILIGQRAFEHDTDLAQGFALGLRGSATWRGRNMVLSGATRRATRAPSGVGRRADAAEGRRHPGQWAGPAQGRAPGDEHDSDRHSASAPGQGRLGASLARPGGNVTGLTVSFDELDGKRLELLKQAFPGSCAWPCFSIQWLSATSRRSCRPCQASAGAWGCRSRCSKCGSAGDLDAAFSLARQHRAQAALCVTTNTTVTHRTGSPPWQRATGCCRSARSVDGAGRLPDDLRRDLDDLARRGATFVRQDPAGRARRPTCRSSSRRGSS